MNIVDKMVNPRGMALRKWMSDLLQERLPKHEQLVDRLGFQLATNQDLHDFGQLAVDLYEVGYLKCLNDYRKHFEALGIKVSVVPETQP